MVARVIKREYLRPYGEFPNLQFDFQIIIQTAKKGIRPTIPSSCPEEMTQLIKSCWAHEADKRPDCKEILAKLDTIEQDFLAQTDVWNATLDPPKSAQP